MKPALLKQPNNEKLLKLKKSERKGAKLNARDTSAYRRPYSASSSHRAYCGAIFSGHGLSMISRL
jgi:hypothetical protein